MKEFHNESKIAREFMARWFGRSDTLFTKKLNTALARLLREAHQAGQDSLNKETK